MKLEGICYGYNGVGFAYLGLGGKGQFVGTGYVTVAVAESDVAAPSDMIALGDGIQGLPDGRLFGGGVSIERARSEAVRRLGLDVQDLKQIDRQVRSVHAGKAMVGFCDGHIGSERLTRLFQDRTPERLRWWNRDHEGHGEWLSH